MTRILGTASVMRHGATHYTGIFPDLAEAGLLTLKTTAREIARRFPKRPVFYASPAYRAVATALHVMEAYGLDWVRDQVFIDPLLSPILVFNYQPLFDHLKRVVGHILDPLERHRLWDIFYMQSRDFESGDFCEPRSSATRRFIEFLKQVPGRCQADCHMVAVTHIELVGSFVHEQFGVSGDYFGPAEVVHLTCYSDGQFEVEFRGDQKMLKF